jgi:alpha-glucoside transport system substrate-binding protein
MLKDWAVRLAMVACIVGAAGLAACGDDDDNGDDTTPSGDATAGNGGGGDEGTVSVLGLWGDEELVSFEAMVADWGGEVQFTGDRAITALLRQRVEANSAPNVAIPAEIGLFQEFAAEGLLTPLSECEGLEDTIRNNYPESFIELGTVDGVLYGFFMKADTKATIFYDPAYFEENSLEPLGDDASFEDLITLSDAILDAGLPPWSMGQEAGDGSGFPASDTIQQIFINEQGADVYDQVVAGEIPYTDDRVVDAWEKFGQLALTEGYTVQGGAAGINATPFMDSSYPPFETPPTAGMVHLGGFASGFITDQFPDAEPGTDFDFMPWPGGAVTGGANIAYAFNNDPATCSFRRGTADLGRARRIHVCEQRGQPRRLPR